MDYVYHCSEISGLKKLNPKLGTHNKKWVYAANDKIISLMFAVNKRKCFGDFSLSKGRDPETGIPFIYERYKGAFKDAYDGISASMYFLNKNSFISGLTEWNEELVSNKVVKIENEDVIDNVYSHLKQYEDEKKLCIYYYPNKPWFYPKNNEDLVIKAAKFYTHVGDSILNTIQKLHPHLLERVILEIAK